MTFRKALSLLLALTLVICGIALAWKTKWCPTCARRRRETTG
jgi:hypothetical protein